MRQLLLAGALLASASGIVTLAQEPVDLRLTRVAVFSSGVAYYESEGSVVGDAQVELRFRTEQINDILKSLVVEDFSGGRVVGVTYPSQDPLERTLKSFGVNLSGNPTLGQLLDQLRGEPIQISEPRALKGTILGVERHKTAGEHGVVEYDVLNLLASGGIEQLPVSGLRGMRFLNEAVDHELQQALAALARGHDADKKAVQINFAGQGSRNVRVAYLLEAPIWKTSYRLTLSADGKRHLMGWATVQNATEEDWKDVRLSLISGRPISFTMDLYTPLYVPRPHEELELYASLRPPTYEPPLLGANSAFTIGQLGPADNLSGVPRMSWRSEGRPESSFGARERRSGAAAVEAASGWGIPAHSLQYAQAQEAGELYEYAIKTPVTIERQRSAMLPIVSQEVTADKVSIFNPQTHARHPVNGLVLTNGSGLHLMQGPVAVFDEGVYAGDAKLPDLKPDEKRLIGYALDLGVDVAVEEPATQDDLLSVRIANGVVLEMHKVTNEATYLVRNRDKRDRVVLLERQANTADWELVEPKEAHEKTAQYWRFRVEVPGGKTVSEKVRFERTSEGRVVFSNVDADRIAAYHRGRILSPAIEAAFARVVELRDERDEASRQVGTLTTDLKSATDDQVRVRANIASLPTESDAYRRQVAKLDALETAIEEINARLATQRKASEAKEAALNDYLLSLDVE
ncbi:MAG: DUF4139 domain-containing protein [Planctomycetes bacterium]|nr:DUF4139 domain-containing protein [Planctomycetota bacterium]